MPLGKEIEDKTKLKWIMGNSIHRIDIPRYQFYFSSLHKRSRITRVLIGRKEKDRISNSNYFKLTDSESFTTSCSVARRVLVKQSKEDVRMYKDNYLGTRTCTGSIPEDKMDRR